MGCGDIAETAADPDRRLARSVVYRAEYNQIGVFAN
jgi:hypothetical protein